MRNAVRKLRDTTDKAADVERLPKVQKMLDKLAKNHIIHKNKAANIKSSLQLHVKSLAQCWNKVGIKVGSSPTFFVCCNLGLCESQTHRSKSKIFSL